MVWSPTLARDRQMVPSSKAWLRPQANRRPGPHMAATHGPQGQATCNKAAWRRSLAPGGYVWPKLSGKALRWRCPRTAVCVARCRWQAPAWGEALPAQGRWMVLDGSAAAPQPGTAQPLGSASGKHAFKKGQKAATGEEWGGKKCEKQPCKHWGEGKRRNGERCSRPRSRDPPAAWGEAPRLSWGAFPEGVTYLN